MTLRTRLVLALVALSTVGLAVFGVVTFGLYARSQYDRVDDQLRATIPALVNQLGGEALGRPMGRRGLPGAVPIGTYGELRDAAGRVRAQTQFAVTSSQPDLPADLAVGEFRTVDSVEGSGKWRVFTAAVGQRNGITVVAAVPLDEVRAALRRLVFIEGVAAAVLLGLLAAGSWYILRRGLRPLEDMATSASSITAGDLSQRVAPADETSEVGQLGLALNTMLGELEAAFREREATEQRLRQFLADASHELRTPLTSIQGFAELFRLGEHEQADVPTILRRIEEESARMATLVEDLLLLARLDQTRPIERVPVDLAVLAADACTDAVATAPDRNVTLHAPEPVVVLGDPGHLRQAIGNLVVNAVRHTPPGTPVEVAAVTDDGVATVGVRDHGEGLDDEALAHVFDRFWQADRARAGKGSGLGLSIVQGIAAEHGGTATAANADGGGAVFTLRLPRS